MKHYIAPGKELPAMAVSDYLAVGMVTLNQLEYFGVKSPWHMAKTPLSKLEEQDIPFKNLRLTMQRTWDKPRVRRADLYSTYIEANIDGHVAGGTPPVTVFISQTGTENDDGTISFPYTCTAIAIDGETQLEARFRLRKRRPETGDLAFPVTIYHGCPEKQGEQILHDFNHYAKPIPESKLGMRNSSGGVSQTIETARASAGVTLNTGSVMGTKHHAAGFQQAMFFVTGYAMGQQALDRTASSWFDALNTPGAPPINGNCAGYLEELFKLVQAGTLPRNMPTYLWQASGVLAHEGLKPGQLKWADGLAAYKNSTPNAGPGAGKGGSKGVTADRLRAIYDALKP